MCRWKSIPNLGDGKRCYREFPRTPLPPVAHANQVFVPGLLMKPAASFSLFPLSSLGFLTQLGRNWCPGQQGCALSPHHRPSMSSVRFLIHSRKPDLHRPDRVYGRSGTPKRRIIAIPPHTNHRTSSSLRAFAVLME